MRMLSMVFIIEAFSGKKTAGLFLMGMLPMVFLHRTVPRKENNRFAFGENASNSFGESKLKFSVRPVA